MDGVGRRGAPVGGRRRRDARAWPRATNTGSYLGAVAQTDADVRTTFSLSAVPTGGGTMVYVSGRRVGADQEYRVRVRFAPTARSVSRVSRLRQHGGATPVARSSSRA